MFTLASSHVTSSRPNQYSEFMNTVHPKIKVFFRQTRVNVFLRTLTVLSAWITFSHCALIHFKQITRIRFPIYGTLYFFFFWGGVGLFFSFFLLYKGKRQLNKLVYIYLKTTDHTMKLMNRCTEIGKTNTLSWSYKNNCIYL